MFIHDGYKYTLVRPTAAHRSIIIIQAQKSAHFARLIPPPFLLGLRQAKVVDGIHGNHCIHGGIVLNNSSFRPRLVGALKYY